jgi:SAM-dependent methyltransferase
MAELRDERPGTLERLAEFLIRPRQGSQGLHPDPEHESDPRPDTWGVDRQDAWFGAEMNTLRDCISLREMGVRDSILYELSNYHCESVEDSYQKCINWEALSIEEWRAADRSSHAGVRDFYETTRSWRYDLSWYGYLQASGHAFPQSAALVRFFRRRGVGGDLLDFGSGIGLNAQVFNRCGFNVTIADVSTPLLDYAAWRLEQHGDDVRALNLNKQSLPQAAFDVVTAFDVLVHVTDFDATARDLHRTIRPGGWLIANFDTRANDEASSWHLQDDEFDLDRRLKRAGFVQRHVIGGFLRCYQRVEPSTMVHRARTARDGVVAPLRRVASVGRRVRWPTPARLVRLLSVRR